MSTLTSRIPQIFAHTADFMDDSRNVLMTQPRRLAGSGTSNRLGVELDSAKLVGLRMRGVEIVHDTSRVIQLTDGMLVEKFCQDPQVPESFVTIIDEVHEQSVNIDLLLALHKPVCYIRLRR